ncbi:MAG TPA: HlyD family efflux transporter periplasmic adaptor subunit [Xanthomonadales bacterium]|nr:HlyD family efflux transporter periplasmic adaptor subunit [Xanthomonadales bacterium]
MITRIPTRNLATIAASALLMFACSESTPHRMVGTLERDRIELLAENNEPIVSRHVQDGQLVSAGDLVVQQDTARLQARLDQQLANREQAAARLAELVRGPRAELILEAEAKLAAAQARTITDLNDLKRAREMFERKLSSQSVLDHAEGSWKASAGAERAAQQELSALQNGTTFEELQQARAALQQAEAQVALAEIDLARSQIRAPVSGRIDKLLYLVGERPAAGATIAILLSDARVYARVYVPEPMRARVIPGKKLPIKVDGVANAFTGEVRWVSADASFTPYFALTEYDRSRLSYLAEIDLPAAAAQLPSGLPLSVAMDEPSRSP